MPRIPVPAVLIALAACGGMAATDLTFYAVSDIHFGQNSVSKDKNRKEIVDFLNPLPGKAYPAAAGGGPVAAPRGVIVPGDLIDFPEDSLWAMYVADYGVNGEGRLKFPVYDGLGNHDVWHYTTSTIQSNIKTSISRRNALRKDLSGHDEEFLHYSWDWDDVHFVQLNLFAGSQPGVAPQWDPFKSLDFLKADLEKHVGTSGRPVLVIQHFPYATNEEYVRHSQRLETARILKAYNCIGILHGHTHAEKVYQYEGIDIYDDGTAMNGDMLVFRIKETKLTVVNRIRDQWGTIAFEKTISLGTPTAVDGRSGRGRQGAEGRPFAFTVAGQGRVFADRGEALRVDIRDSAGRAVRTLKVTGGSAEWDRKDAAGRAAGPGVYLAKVAMRNGPGKALKFALR